ncbi:MAG: potassium-transporting ATPase subunit B, partial [Dongiaceae bacterium]
MTQKAKQISMLDGGILKSAVRDSIVKLDPRKMVHNPVMFAVEVVALGATIIVIRDLSIGKSILFSGQIVFWLWLTVLFGNFAEAVAEGRGKAQADALRKTRSKAMAKKLSRLEDRSFQTVSALSLVPGDIVLVEPGDLMPGDGDVVEGIASVDESAITGESA